LEKAINWITIFNLAALFLMAFTMTVNSYNFNKVYADPDGFGTGAYYIFENKPQNLELRAFGSYYLLFNLFIPF
jgi:MarR-like DNA-binding transcriptional regulator SgrR of sgrS sRNA